MSSASGVSKVASVAHRISERLRRVAGLAEVISHDKMILVGGMSRSGTTLLTTVLDSHPQLAVGAELLPSGLIGIEESLRKLSDAISETGGDFSAVGRHLRQQDDRNLGLFFVRCHRAGVTYEEVRDALCELVARLPGTIELLGERLLIAQAVMKRRAERENAVAYGFKYTSSATDITEAYLPNSSLLCIVRDPRDVVVSHLRRGFDKSVEDIAKTWRIYSARYRQFADKHPTRCRVIRYEDLTRQPYRTLEYLFEILPVELEKAVLEFYRSDSPIHAGFHPNADRLRMNFATDSIGRGYHELSAEDLRTIEAVCGDELEAFGYDNRGYFKIPTVSGTRNLVKISNGERRRQAARFNQKRKFKEHDYAELLARYLGKYEIMPMADYVRIEDVGERKILLIRHDVDHDLENALRIARWEAERGIRATYCLLHTAWYYGELDGERYRHSDMLIDGIRQLVEYGHEINLHNNLVTLALQQGVNPIAVLKSELEFYDSLGVAVTGTSTHGDALCRTLNYRNWELFRECCDDRFGGPRVVEHQVGSIRNRCRLGEFSMFELGLEYEAYDIGKDAYHTESGGRMRVRTMTRGRRQFGRDNGRGSVCGVLTHPVWWDFGDPR